MALSDNLVAYWSLEEASGTRADVTGRGNDLTANNSPANTTGKVGNAASFNGTNQWFSRVSTSDLVMGDVDFTITCWVNASNVTPQRYVWSKYGGVPQEYSMLIDSGNRFKFYIANFAKVVSADNFGAPSTSTSYFIVCQHDSVNDLIKISVNNGTMNTAATAGSFPSASGTQPFAIGSAKGGLWGVGWGGWIDEVGIWKRLLSGAEITDLYNSGNGRSYAYITTPAGGLLRHPGMDGGMQPMNGGMRG